MYRIARKSRRDDAALANAIYHAAGVRLRTLPMKPSTIMEAVWAK
mgnify:CR=1 FL=1